MLINSLAPRRFAGNFRWINFKLLLVIISKSGPHWWWANISSCNGLLPDGTKPLPDLMLAHHQRGSMVLTQSQFHRKYSRCQFTKWVLKNTLCKLCPHLSGTSELSYTSCRAVYHYEPYTIMNLSHTQFWAIHHYEPWTIHHYEQWAIHHYEPWTIHHYESWTKHHYWAMGHTPLWAMDHTPIWAIHQYGPMSHAPLWAIHHYEPWPIRHYEPWTDFAKGD